jgi:hypothetical protein
MTRFDDTDLTRRGFAASLARAGALGLLGAAAAGSLLRPAAAQDQPGMLERAGNWYEQNEVIGAVENFFGSTAKGAAEIVSKIFGDLGNPNAFFAGEEASAAFAVGLRYGDGWLYRKGEEPRRVYWQGPSVGFDFGANASKCFTLVYGLSATEALFQRFPGIEGTGYFIAGMGVNYLRSAGITLAPIRTGVGARAGINAGYLHVTPEQEWFPF